ncbi:MAG: ferritin-like domain-containing protein [Bacteroidetes bacterium]|nr:MAG: ferritin-like domain-containing protein [Bacteroidota bacterium]
MPTTKNRTSVRTRRARTENTSSPRSSSSSKSSGQKQTRSSNGKATKSENGSLNGNSQLEKLFTDSLKDIYWAEKHLTKALPKMKKKATTDELRSAIEEHLAQTEEHVSRLEQVFEMCGKKAQAKKCDAMEGLTKEADSIIEETESNTMTRDAGIIMAAQKVEHYEIATYGSLVQLAKTLGMNDAAEVLYQTLEEEKQADEKLTEIAEWNVNQAATQEEGEEDEEEDDNEDEEEDNKEEGEEEEK